MSDYFASVSQIISELSEQADFQRFNLALKACLCDQPEAGACKSIYVAGNGGSFSSALHISTDISCLYEKGIIATPSLVLASQAQITRTANDYGYEHIFSRDLQASSHSIKAVFALSVSGNSANIVNLLSCARDLRIPTFSLLGFNGAGQAKRHSDYSVSVDSTNFRIVEDVHMLIVSSLLYSIANN